MASPAPALPAPPRVLLLTWQPISPGRPHLDEAFALRSEGRLRAAAMLARVAVETHLVAICRGRKVRCIADGVKILTGVRILTSREGRELLDSIAVGNHAAHGRHVAADAVDAMLATADELLGRWYVVPPTKDDAKPKRVRTPLQRAHRTARRRLLRQLRREFDELAISISASASSFALGVPR